MIFTIPVASRVEDFDQEGLLTPHAVLSVFENTAIRHAETTGYSPMGDSLRNGMAWVITNWRVEVARAPSYDQPLTASTWLCRTPRQATREMLLRAADGEVLARGQAKLALVDRATGKPCLPTADRLAPYGPETATAFADRLPRLRPPARWDAETPVRLRRADIDYNGHLHNTAYLDLALDAAPDALCRAGVHTFRISYRSPLRPGDAPVLRSSALDDGGWAAAFVLGDEVCAVVAVNEVLAPLP